MSETKTPIMLRASYELTLPEGSLLDPTDYRIEVEHETDLNNPHWHAPAHLVLFNQIYQFLKAHPEYGQIGKKMPWVNLRQLSWRPQHATDPTPWIIMNKLSDRALAHLYWQACERLMEEEE